MDLCPRHRIELSANGFCPSCVAGTALAGAETEVETPFAVIGNYELLAELGRGGMGIVYRARQSGLNREVALKLLPVGILAGGESVRRFRLEAEMAAKLQHPNIAQVFEAGEVEGELYYSMEWVPGGDLAEYFEPGKLPPAEAARLTVELALALDHAHRQGVLHRDLKPSNILVDDAGKPKIADFGLARPFDTTGENAGETRPLGSPAYLAPELVRGSAATPAADLYSLGAVLYFLLCGRPPFVSATLDELLRQVRDCEPPPPRLLNPAVPKDLQKICLKALDKHPGRRYDDAASFAGDLQRFLEGRPVLARPVGPLVKGWRAAKRAPWLAGSLAALAVVLVLGIAGVLSQARIANQRAAEVREKAAALRLHLYASDVLAASLSIQRGETSLADDVLSRWSDSPPDEDPRGFEWWHLKDLSRPTAHRRLDRRDATITSVAASDDGRWIAVADQGGQVKLHPADGGTARTLPGRGDHASFIPSSLGGGLALSDPDGVIRWYDPEDRLIAEHPGRQFSLAVSSSRAAVASVPRYHWWVHGGDARVLDWRENRTLREFPGDWAHVVLSPDGEKVALAGVRGGLKISGISEGSSLDLPFPVPVWGLSFTPDGLRLAASHRHGALIWDLEKPEGPPSLFPHALTVWTTGFSRDGRLLLTSCSDRRTRIWKARDPSVPPRVLSGHHSEVWSAAFLGDHEVISGGKDRDALRWTLEAARETTDAFLHNHNDIPVFSPDGRRFLTQNSGRPELHDLGNDQRIELPAGFTGLGFSPDGAFLLLVDSGGIPGRAPLEAPERFTPFPSAAPAGTVRHWRGLSGGRWIARVTEDGVIGLLDPDNGSLRHQVRGPVPRMRHATTGSPDGRWLAVCGDGEEALVLHDLRQGKTLRLEPPSPYYYLSSSFSPDGTMLAAGDMDGPVRVWSVPGGNLIATLPGHPEETSGVSFSPDGKTLASLGCFQGLKLWHVATWSELHSVDMEGAAHHLAFSPDGRRLAVTFGAPRSERIDWLLAPRESSGP